MKFLYFIIVTVAFLTISEAKPSRQVLVEVFDDDDEQKDRDDDDRIDQDDRDDQEEYQIDQDRNSPIIQVGSLDREDQERLEEVINGVADNLDAKKSPSLAKILELQEPQPVQKPLSVQVNLAEVVNQIKENKMLRSKPIPLIEFVGQSDQAKDRLKVISVPSYGNRDDQNNRVSKFALGLTKLLNRLSGDNLEDQDLLESKNNKKIRVKRVEGFYPKKEKPSAFIPESKLKDRSPKDLVEILKRVLPLVQKDSSLSGSSLDDSRDDDTNIYVLQPHNDGFRIISPRVNKKASRPLENNKYRLQLLRSLDDDGQDDDDDDE